MDDDIDGKDDTKRKSRNLSEKKRRDQFNMLINELSSMVSTNSRKMDKSTVLKSTIAFLKSHTETSAKSRVHEIQEDWKPSFLSNEEFTHLILEALDGFILVFSASGKILYSSDSVISLLGHKPNDLLNMSIYDLIFEDDQADLYNLMLNPNCAPDGVKNNNQDNSISFSCYIKRGGNDPSYELVHFVGYFRDDIDTPDSDKINSNYASGLINEADNLVFVVTGHLDQPHLLREITVVDSIKSEFTSKHSLEWKFLFLDHRAPPIIGYLPFEVLGTSGYDYYHIDDLDKVVTCHEALMQKGEGTSCYYRFLTKGQQWIWLQSRFYITYHQWNSKPEFIVSTNKVVNYMNILKQMDCVGDYEDNQNDNEVVMQDSNSKSVPPPSSPWSSKSSVGKASRLALTGVSSPTPSMSVMSSGTRGRGRPVCGGQPDSDSNSLSADSFSSKRSFPRSNLHFHGSQQQCRSNRKTPMEQPYRMPCLQMEEPIAECSHRQTQLSADPANSFGTVNAVMNQQLSQQQYVDSNTQQHFMAAIPVQPVLATSGYSAATSLSQAELLHPPLVMTPAQTQLQEQLQRKHEELQQLIFQQQQELRLVSDQLLMARYGLLPASLLSVSVPYSMANSSGTPVVTNAAQQPTSLPLPSTSDLYVNSHHSTLVHPPLAVAPPLIMDTQQVNLQASLQTHAGGIGDDLVHFQMPQQQAPLLFASNMPTSTPAQYRQ